MRSFDDWMNDYGQDHKNPINQKIHLFCVPLILFSILGLLWNVRWPFSESHSLFNGATVLTLLSLSFYARLSLRYALAMAFVVLPMLLLMFFWEKSPYFIPTMIVVFIVAWMGQFIGHKIEKQKPSFLKDIQFLMIGPLWVIKKITQI